MPKSSAAFVLLVLAASLLLVGDLLQLTTKGIAWTVVLALSFTAFAAGLLLLPVAIGAPTDRLARVGSVLAFLGAVAGAAMQAMFRAWEVLEAASEQQALTILQHHKGVTLTTLAPGILFPLGLLVLSAALFRLRGPVAAGILAVGALLFPVGHAAGLTPALVAGDLVLLAAFATLALSRFPRIKVPAVSKNF